MRTCPRCKETKEPALFHKSTKRPDGLQIYCKVCQKAAKGEWNRANPERLAATKARSQALHPDAGKKAARKYYEANKQLVIDRSVAWKVANPEKASIRNRDRNYRDKYGLTLAQVEAMSVSQGGLCRICTKPLRLGTHTHVDHCHKTGVV